MNTHIKTYLSRQSIQRKIGIFMGYTILLLLSAIFLIPFLRSLSASLAAQIPILVLFFWPKIFCERDHALGFERVGEGSCVFLLLPQ